MRAKWLEEKPGAKADDRAGLIEFAAGELRRALGMGNDDLAKQLMARIPIPPERAGVSPQAVPGASRSEPLQRSYDTPVRCGREGQ